VQNVARSYVIAVCILRSLPNVETYFKRLLSRTELTGFRLTKPLCLSLPLSPSFSLDGLPVSSTADGTFARWNFVLPGFLNGSLHSREIIAPRKIFTPPPSMIGNRLTSLPQRYENALNSLYFYGHFRF